MHSLPLLASMLSDFAVSQGLPAVLTLVVSAVTVLLFPFLKRLLEAQAGTHKIAAAGLRVEQIVEAMTAHVLGGLEPLIREAAADGTIDAVERQKIKDSAVALSKEALTQQGLDSLGGILGLGAGLVDIFISGKVEQAMLKATDVASPK